MITRNEYMFRIVEAAHLRSSCDEAASGVAIAIEDTVLAVASADSVVPGQSCAELGHEYVSRRVLVPDPEAVGGFSWQNVQRCERAMHSVIAALTRALRTGAPVTGATLYGSAFPCVDCAKAIISAGIVEVRVAQDLPGSGPAKELLTAAGVRWFVGVE